MNRCKTSSSPPLAHTPYSSVLSCPILLHAFPQVRLQNCIDPKRASRSTIHRKLLPADAIMSFYLPAIPEEGGDASSAASAASGSEATTPVEEVVRGGGDGYVGGEGEGEGTPSSHADDEQDNESLAANSYAFTLGDVGFDEENSLVDSVAGGSVFFRRDGTWRYRGGRGSEDSTLSSGFESSPETSPPGSVPRSSPSDGSGIDGSVGRDDSILGSLSVSSCSGDELERKRKVDRLWPWPTGGEGDAEGRESARDQVEDPPADDATLRASASGTKSTDSATEAGSGDVGNNDLRAVLSQATSLYANKAKSVLASFSDRVEVAYRNANAKRGRSDAGVEAETQSPVDGNNGGDSPPAMMCEKSQPSSWIGAYKAADPKKRLGIGFAVLLMLGDTTDVNAADLGGASAPSEPGTADAKHGTAASPAAAPSSDPTPGPAHVALASPGDGDEAIPTEEGSSCVDLSGKFANAEGKRRKGHWLIVDHPDALRSERLNVECGARAARFAGIATELRRSCWRACRAYNGCATSRDVGDAGGDDMGAEAPNETVQAAPTEVLAEVRTAAPSTVAPTTGAPATIVPTGPPTRWPTTGPSAVRRDANCVNVRVQVTCPLSCADYVFETSSVQAIPGTEAPLTDMTKVPSVGETQSSTEAPPTFVDVGGRERECWWLDIRNVDQRQDGAAGGVTNQIQSFDIDRSGGIPSLVLEQRTKMYEHPHDPLPQDMCEDGRGYYLNHHGKPKQCSWLTNGHDPTDETRRIKNCGYRGSEYPEGTDLGRMCQNTCGTCGV
ncbi:hypothetical protein ACHAWF_012545 [Thalassiosira exigua]